MSKPICSKYLNLLLLFLSIVIVSSCSTSKRTIRTPLKEQGADFLFENLKKNELRYDYLSARFSATFIQDKNRTTFSGQIRIQKDSLIWISISPALGIEMARVLISNDSILYMNRIENTYFAGNIDYINSLINSTLDFDMLQSFLTGNDFSFYENSSFKAGIDNHEYKLITTDRRKLKKYVRNNQEISIPLQNIWLNAETFKISRVLIKELVQNGRKLEGKYEYILSEGQLVPASVRFELETSDKRNTIELSYSKISTSGTLQFPFKIPEKYKKVNGF
ncbi:MAG: hypothetical protein CVT94_12870 [Bacteroidetes bacterium HGW-Bacteroidetes-11]|jgi:hypothetical protein|nr:MAG: hypothetical protein CVT94_12870 [Bacteroidetes bacterium HGW-Bacteroidetes-11]